MAVIDGHVSGCPERCTVRTDDDPVGRDFELRLHDRCGVAGGNDYAVGPRRISLDKLRIITANFGRNMIRMSEKIEIMDRDEVSRVA